MYFKLRGERDEVRHEVQTLQAEADSLEQAIDLLANDPAALERIAREEYNMRRPAGRSAAARETVAGAGDAVKPASGREQSGCRAFLDTT